MESAVNDIRNKIEANFIPEPNSGCFIWLMALNDAGYGMLNVAEKGVNRVRRVHRLYYEFIKGPIPKGLVLDHKCRVRCCCNPDHLQPVTIRENNLLGESFCAEEAGKTHCPSGHPYGGSNLFYDTRGARKCRTCDRKRALRWHHANRSRSNTKRARNKRLAAERKRYAK